MLGIQHPAAGRRRRGTDAQRPACAPSLAGQCRNRQPSRAFFGLGRSCAAAGWAVTGRLVTNPGRSLDDRAPVPAGSGTAWHAETRKRGIGSRLTHYTGFSRTVEVCQGNEPYLTPQIGGSAESGCRAPSLPCRLNGRW